MSSELLATYAGLGTHDGERYYKGEECLACVKDLIRALRADDSRCEIRRELGRARVLQKDLLSILLSCPDDDALRNDVIRLLVNLTQPAYLCFGESLPKKKEFDSMRCYMEVEGHLRRYKEAFTVEAVLNMLGSVLANLCQKDWDHRDDDDIIIIERILLLIRNVLHVSPDPQEEKRTEDDVSVHDQLVWNLHINGIDELLLFLGSNSEETQWCMHVLEIIFLILREQSPSALAGTGREKTAEEKKRDEDLIDEALAKERERRARAMKIRSTRHSRFGGTFVVKNQRSISGTERVYHRSIAGLKSHSYDIEKKPRRTNKDKRPMCDPPSDRLSTFSIRLVLKNMCVQFLECCYNPLMKIVRDNIRHNRSMENDDTYYLWAVRFFMEFCRCHDFRVDIVGETLQLGTFHYLIQLMASYYESMVLEKRERPVARQWAQRLHYAVQGYHELLKFIHEMTVSNDETFRENSKVMLSNLVYHQEYRDVFVSLLRNYNEVVQSKSFLCVLVEATHLYVRMMERYCHGNSHMIVQQKKKKGTSKKKRKSGGGAATGYVLTNDGATDLWETIDGRVMELLEGHEPLPESEIPFDAASDVPVDEQKITTMARVRAHLIDANHPEAIALFRAARTIWPEEDFGRDGMTVSEETGAVKAILFNPAAATHSARLVTNVGEEEDGEEGEGEGGEGGGEAVTYETEFEVKKFIQRFSNNKIVRAYSVLLSNYRNNPTPLNHAVVKMLYRIAVQMKMAPLLYQISVFRILHSILQEPPSSRFHELQKFCRHIVSGFFATAEKNPLIFVELLFWKTSQDVYELTEGYGTLERERAKKQLSTMWTREQEEELEELFQRFRNEDDVVACILAGLPQDIPRTRKQVVKQLLAQELIGSSKELAKKATKKTGEWTEEELGLLKEAVEAQMEGERQEEGERDKDIVQEVTSTYFPERGVRNVGSKMRELGLIGRARKKGGKSAAVESASVEDAAGRRSSLSRGEERGKRKRREKGEKTKVSRTDVARLVMSLSCRGYEEELAWLEAYLRDEARDRTVDDEWEEMCIVAVGEAVSKMFRETDFQNLLSSLHMQPPSNTEVYWRIPSSMSPRQLENAANSLRPSSILDDHEVERESDSEESERENEDQESDRESSASGSCSEPEPQLFTLSPEGPIHKKVEEIESKEEVESQQDVVDVNEEEVGEEPERAVSPDHSESDVELVIDFGDGERDDVMEEESRSAAMRQLVQRKRVRGRRRERQRSHRQTPEPKPKKARVTQFLASDSEEEGEDHISRETAHTEGDGGSVVPGVKGGSEGGGASKHPRKLALDSSDSESETDDSESGSDGELKEEVSTGVNLSEDGSNCVDQRQNITTDIRSPVMDTAELVDTCDLTTNTADTRITDPRDTVDTIDLDPDTADVEMTPTNTE